MANKASQDRLYRSHNNKILGGVCGGIGEYFSIDPSIIRLVFILLAIFGGSGFLAYLILWLIIPSEKSKIILTKAQIDENLNDIKKSANTASSKLNFDPKSRSQKIWAVVLIVGLIIILNNSKILNIWAIWPYLLVGIGIYMLLKNKNGEKNN